MSFLENTKSRYTVEAKLITDRERAEQMKKKARDILQNRRPGRSVEQTEDEAMDEVDRSWNEMAKKSEKPKPSFMQLVKTKEDAKQFQKTLKEQAADLKKGEKKRRTRNYEKIPSAKISPDLADTIGDAFKKYPLFLEFADDYVNISRDDGVHVEYNLSTDGSDHWAVVNMDDEDFELPGDADAFAASVNRALSFDKRKKK